MLTTDDGTQTSTVLEVGILHNDLLHTAESLIQLQRSDHKRSKLLDISTIHQSSKLISEQQPMARHSLDCYQRESRHSITTDIVSPTAIKKRDAYLPLMMELINSNGNGNNSADTAPDEAHDYSSHRIDMSSLTENSMKYLEEEDVLSSEQNGQMDSHIPLHIQPSTSFNAVKRVADHSCVCVHCHSPISTTHSRRILLEQGFSDESHPNSTSVPESYHVKSSEPWQKYAGGWSMQSTSDEQPTVAFPKRRTEPVPSYGSIIKHCSNCGATNTPSWRRCSEGRALLCNACGLYQKLHKRRRPVTVDEEGRVRVARERSGGDASDERAQEPYFSNVNIHESVDFLASYQNIHERSQSKKNQ